MHKFGVLRDGADVPFVYPNTWERAQTSGPDRLVIAPSRDHIGLLLRLAAIWASNYHLLYVLVVPRGGGTQGRYQSPNPVAYHELEAFLQEHAAFISTDGRHHVWVGSTDGDGTLVYDRHNLIYAYGPLDSYVALLRDAGFSEAAVRVPVPHAHHYHAENDPAEAALLSHWAWVHSPLQPGDDDLV